MKLEHENSSITRIFESKYKILNFENEMKATEQYFPPVLFIMLYKVVLTFESELSPNA